MGRKKQETLRSRANRLMRQGYQHMARTYLLLAKMQDEQHRRPTCEDKRKLREDL